MRGYPKGMNRYIRGKRLAPGEGRCFSCGNALPRTEFWPGRRLVCDKVECFETVAAQAGAIVIAEQARKCFVPGCESSVPAGIYDRRLQGTGKLICSVACFRRARNLKRVWKCDHCGREALGADTKPGKHKFCSLKCHANWQTEKTAERCGPFLPIYREYVNGFAREHYSGTNLSYRHYVSFFLGWLVGRGINDLDAVTPSTITAFLAYGDERERRRNRRRIPTISTFFNWLLAEGKREHANPVVPKIHGNPARKPNPRPYSEDEMEQIWRMLEERGSTVAKLAVAIMEETGLRGRELARLRVEDLDPKAQTVFVRLPTKNGEERVVPFHDRTKRYAEIWLKERDPECGHNRLLHTRRGQPFSRARLAKEIELSVCKTVRGKTVNATGLDEWHGHRCRHVFASRLGNNGADVATLMALGGWRSAAAMEMYTKINPAVVRRGYDEAMRRARQLQANRPKTMSLESYARGKRQSPEAVQNQQPAERDV